MEIAPRQILESEGASMAMKKFIFKNKICRQVILILIVSVFLQVFLLKNVVATQQLSRNEETVKEYLKLKSDIEQKQKEFKKLLSEEFTPAQMERAKNKAKRLERNILEKIEKLKKVIQGFQQDNYGMRNIEEFALRIQEQEEKGNIVKEVYKQDTEGLFTVFGIPLDADYRTILSIFDSRDIYVYDGVEQYHNKSCYIEKDIEHRLVNEYLSCARGNELKGVFSVFDNQKFTIYDAVHNNNRIFLIPSSFYWFLSRNRVDGFNHPLFTEYYKIYNSQFYLQCPYPDKEMTSAHIIGMEILLTRIEDMKAPRSFLICFQLDGSDKIIPILTKKYGIPKLHYPTGDNVFTSDRELNASIEKFLLKEHPNNEKVNCKIIGNNYYDYFHQPAYIYQENAEILAPLKSVRPSHIEEPFKVHLPFPELSQYVLEWQDSNVKILLECELISSHSSGVNSIPTLIPSTINYIDWPVLEKLTLLYKNYLKEITEYRQKVIEEGKSGF